MPLLYIYVLVFMLVFVFLDFDQARVQMKLMSAMPLIKIIQFSLMEPPKIDFILKPLKSLDIMDVGLSCGMRWDVWLMARCAGVFF